MIIPAGIAGAWTGFQIHLFWRFPLPFLTTLPGAPIRITHVVYQAYFIHLAILIAIHIFERKKQAAVADVVLSQDTAVPDKG